VSIAIRLNSRRYRRWHLDFQKRVETKIREKAFFEFEPGPAPIVSVELLLDLEKLLYFQSGPSPIELLNARSGNIDVQNSKIIVNLTGGRKQFNDDLVTFTPLYDGVPEEEALLGALIDGRVPHLEIEVSPGSTIVESEVVILEEARSVRERFEYLTEHVQRMLLRALSAPGRAAPKLNKERSPLPNLWRMGRSAARLITSSALRRLYQLCLHSPHWRVGWRFVGDDGVWARRSLGGVPWTSISDTGSHFYADPFPFTFEGRTFVLVEDFDHYLGRGIISAIPFDQSGQIGSAEPVLSEPWHLSYPFVFEHDGQVWMMPESAAARKVSLYRGAPFPSRWAHEVDLLEDVDAHDASIVKFGGKWWIFATLRDQFGGAFDSLVLFFSDDLFGPYLPHNSNPVLTNASQARQAGQFLLDRGRLFRPVQDCRGGYGRALGLAEVLSLNQHEFAQVVSTELRPDVNWPGRRLHTLNKFDNLECIDGSRNSPKLAAHWFAGKL
jgi:hypothetical protein